MNFNIYLEDELYKRLNAHSKETHLSRNLIIRSALDQWLRNHEKTEWPKDFFKFTVDPDFPSVESLRKGLLPSSEDPLA